MDADGRGADEFEFNLTRVLESLDRRQPSLSDLRALGEPAAADPAPGPLIITPMSDDEPAPLAPLPHRVPPPRSGSGGQRTRPAPRPERTTPPEGSDEPLPTRTTSGPKTDLVPPGRTSMFDEAANGEARAALHRVPVDTNVAVAALDTPVLPAPKLPAVTVAGPPEATVAAATPMPTAADVRQFQNAQRRQANKSRQGRVMGRMMLVVLLFTTAVGLALTVGRSYLFPADWSDELAPLVADVEAARGAEFDQVVTVVEQLPADYATTVTRAVLGPDPATRFAVWRALGVATGDIDAGALGTQLAGLHPAVYDAESGTIVRLAGVSADLRPVLAEALDHQLGDADAAAIGVLGPVPPALAPATPADLTAGGPLTPPVGAVTAAEQVVAEPSLTTPPSLDTVDAAATALPVAYQQAAAARLAPLLRDAAMALPADTVATAPEATLAAGDTAVGDPVTLGIDDWTLVWANRLPAASVDTLVAATNATSIRTFDRGGATCVSAAFQAGNEMFAAALLSDLGQWAAAAPAEAQAAVTQVAPTYVHLTACDPGPVAQALAPAAVDAVLGRQTARLEAALAAPSAASPVETGSTPAPTVP